MPGVVKYLTYADIPPGGINNFMPPSGGSAEELFCSNEILYAGQALGLIIAGNSANAGCDYFYLPIKNNLDKQKNFINNI